LTQALHALIEPVRARAIARYLGQTGTALGLLGLAPFGVALWTREWRLASAYGVIAAVLLVVGIALRRTPAPPDLRKSEALVVPALLFVLAPCLYAIPLVQAGVPWMDALFEAVSGITTTGLSTLASVENWPRAFLFARAWQQWVGGLGIIVLALALFIGPGAAARRLASSQLPRDDLVGSTRLHARRVLRIYIAWTLLGAVLLWSLGLTGLDAAAHALAAVSTGGFSTHDASLVGLDSWGARGVVMGLCLVGAISFSVYLRPRRIHLLLRDIEVWTLVGLAGSVAAALVILRWWTTAELSLESSAHGLLTALSAQTTAGFSTTPIAELDASSKLLLIGSMLIGGDVGSTAGGIKVMRILIAWRVVRALVLRQRIPDHAVLDVRLGATPIKDAELLAVFGILGLFGAVIGASWLAFVLFGYDPIDALFEVVSATGTVGLTTGITRPELEIGLKALLCVDMWMGRLEIIPLLLLISPGTWLARKESTA
jgi:trk system potassium uptake protein TrkH